MWNGQRQVKNHYYDTDYPCMSKLRKSLVNLVYEIGNYSGCHQLPERSFFYQGHQFPVCARCTGVCLGQLTAILLNFFRNIPLSLSILCLFIMGIDWGIQEIGIKASTNPRRLITGFLGGFGLFNLYGILLKRLLSCIKRCWGQKNRNS